MRYQKATRTWGLVIWALVSPLAARAQTTDNLKTELDEFSRLLAAKQWVDVERQAHHLVRTADRVLAGQPEKLAGYYDLIGALYAQHEVYDNAEEFYLRGVQLHHAANSYWQTVTADAYSGLGDARYYQAKYLPAIEAYERTLQIRERLLGKQDLTTATSYRDIAWCWYKADDNAKAAQNFQQCFQIRAQVLGAEHPSTLNILSELADARYFEGQYDVALQLYGKARAGYEKQSDSCRAELAKSLRDEGLTLEQLRRMEEAEEKYRQAIEQQSAVEEPDPARTSGMMRCLADLLEDKLQFAESEKWYRAALSIAENELGDDHIDTATCLNGLAGSWYEQGRYAEAEPLYRRSLEIREAQDEPDSLSIALACTNLAGVYFQQSRYQLAHPLFRRALELRQENLPEDDPLIAEALNNLGVVLRTQRRVEEALPLYEQALAIRQAKLAADDPLVAGSLENLANLQSELGHNDAAEKYFVQALAIYRQAHGETHPDVAGCLARLADLRYNQGQPIEAEALSKQSLTIFEQTLGQAHPRLASSLYDLAWFQLEGDRASEALATLDRAVDITRQAAVSAHDAFTIYSLRGKCHWTLDQRPDAVRDLQHAMELAEQQREQTSGGELERASFFARFSSVFDLMVEWQSELGDLELALNAIERSRSRSLLDEIGLLGADLTAGQTGSSQQQMREAADQLREQLRSLEAQLAAVLKQPANDETAAERTRIGAAIQRTQESLYRNYRDARTSSEVYRNKLADSARLSEPLSLRDVQRKLLGPKTLLLVYHIGSDAGYLLTARANSARLDALSLDDAAAQSLGVEAGPLNYDRVQQILLSDNGVMQALARPKTAVGAVPYLSALWGVLIGDAERQSIVAGEIERLIVAPSGPLSLLPFEALVTAPGGTPKYLLDVGPPISYAPSVTVLDALRIRPAVDLEAEWEPVLTLGDPSYAAEGADITAEEASRAVLLRNRLTPLPHSGVESQWVSEVFQKSGMTAVQLRGAEATEGYLREYGPGRRILHLACHGFADQSYGNVFGALALARPAEGEFDPSDDGMLTLGELYELDLRGCELAILSACQTNFGPQQQGEGVWALSRGFLVSGARRVVASNWVVDDEAAASLVSYYCGALAKSAVEQRPHDYDLALRDAKRWIRSQKRWESPYYWASLVLVGPP
ncbi:MAG: CHAT domain-containing protein [Pirellulales bacterium]|nr:CHAT domain-containing protein [Pirellulales bacterium]